MNILTELLSTGVDKVVQSVGTAMDNLITSDEEKGLLKNELEKIKASAILEAENNYLKHEEEITKRWTNDNEHFITRMTRPFIVLWSFALLSVVMLGDGNLFSMTIKEAYIPILETIVVTVVVAYFGSRGIEKLKKNK